MPTQLRTIVPSPPHRPGGHRLLDDDDDPPSSYSSSLALGIATPVKMKSPATNLAGGGGTATTATDMCVDDIVTGGKRGNADGVLQIVRPRASAATVGAVRGKKGGGAGGPGAKRLSRPKLPMSGYNLFVRDERELLRRSKGSGGHQRGSADVGRPEVKAAINEKWRRLDRRTKEKYNRRGRDEMARYKDEMEIYKRMAGDDQDDEHEGKQVTKKPKRQTGLTGVTPTTHSASAFQFVPIAARGTDGVVGDVDDDLDAALALASYATLAERAAENQRRIRENEATLAALARKEDFVLFLRILTKHLQLVDPELHARARRVVRECVEAYRREYGGEAKVLGDSSSTLSLSVYDMADRLRDAVGPKHFARAEAMANAYSYRRGGQ